MFYIRQHQTEDQTDHQTASDRSDSAEGRTGPPLENNFTTRSYGTKSVFN
jgi:hypothetical protein